ncbi:hypothetical protein ACLF3G_02830 [Falsiroseomonas sp. HC035]|uniref:hypothetical protein n=1 Tax=Falsiroseomonas sp. HC035 TaxID=3390999 RepID=UPI003D3116FA
MSEQVGDTRTLEERRASSQAGQQQWGWDAKNVPQHVKNVVAGLPKVVQDQYEITLLNMASQSASLGPGDGALRYLSGWNHKRFSGQYCLLYKWELRNDGKGYFLAVKGIGRKNGNGNDYGLI